MSDIENPDRPKTETVVPEDELVNAFAAKTGETFSAGGQTLTLVGAEASVKFAGAAIEGVPVGVQLTFEGSGDQILPEGTYVIEGEGTTLALHIQPIHTPDGAQRYQAMHDE
jgi:hypothetical protein